MKTCFLFLSLVLLDYSNCYAQNTFPSTGNTGIGTTTPGSALTVAGGGTGVSIQPGGAPYFGTLAFNRESATGTIFDSRGFGFQINNGGTDTDLHFQVWSGQGDLVTSNAIVIAGNGYVGIGTATPKESLSVKGNIRSQQIKVETANWPDYVFKPAYSLLPLSEVKTYIDKNQHLPDMPSATEISKDGLNLGEMNKLLTRKVEELTLYLLQIKEENDKLNKENQTRITALEQEVIILSRNKSK